MPHHLDADRILVAHLTGAASRHAGWRAPEGPAREAAIRELVAIATVTPQTPRGSLHQPEGILRTDLLAEVAGLLPVAFRQKSAGHGRSGRGHPSPPPQHRTRGAGPDERQRNGPPLRIRGGPFCCTG